jgi:L-fuculose-phosphate aldolase
MKNVISVRDLEEMLRRGQDPTQLPPDVILTPSARDFLRDLEDNGGLRKAPAAGGSSPTARPAAPAKPPTSKSPRAELEAFFNSPEIHALKEKICDIGRRMWQRNYVDGNGGNIAIRVGEDIALCTPTLVSKGFMKPSDICLVDLEGNQLLGEKKRTSEILMHLQIMKRQPRAVATVHCHPPAATAFAVANLSPPTCMIPEIEVMIGTVPVAEYRTPGTPEMGKLVADLVDKHNTILMGNHGAVSWSHVDVEDAYFKMEILEAYCNTIVIGTHLGVPLKTFEPKYLQDILKIKSTLGIPDARVGLKECELCDNSEWRPGVTCMVPPKTDTAGPAPDPQAEALVQAITDQIMSQLK